MISFKPSVFVILLLLVSGLTAKGRSTSYLSVEWNNFMYEGERVFLSGANQAWISYGYDFGNSNYKWARQKLERFLREISASGGNSVRIWVHTEGNSTPFFDRNGYVIGIDQNGSFLDDVRDYLSLAQKYNVFVFFCLWNGAYGKSKPNKLRGLIKGVDKLDSYIEKALIPLVSAVKGFPSLGGWDIMNEPEGVLDLTSEEDDDSCFGTRELTDSGVGWAGKHYSLKELLRFINIQADAIHKADPKSLVTVGAWNARSTTDRMCMKNYYKDSCLVAAGGKTNGTLDFYQVHTYDYHGHYDQYSPFKNRAIDYGYSKPIVIGEFNQVRGAGMDITEQFTYAYNNKYNGAWSWHASATGENSDTWTNQKRGIRSLLGFNDQWKGGRVNVSLTPP